jgi:hypothetical protein
MAPSGARRLLGQQVVKQKNCLQTASVFQLPSVTGHDIR